MRSPATTFALTFAGTTRPTWWSALVLLVVATFGIVGCADQEPITPLSPQKALAPSGLDALSYKRVEQSERRVTELPDGRVLEVLHGEPAYRHLKELMARRPGAFANLSLRAKGYRPSGEVLIQRVKRPQRVSLRGDGFFMLAQSYQESNGEGEIIFWSWDDGDPATWEGVIWFEDYNNNIAGTNEAQIDISSTESTELVWWENTWQSGGGGGGPGDIEPTWNPAPCATIAPGVRFASLDLGSKWVANGYTLASYGGFSWRSWGRCTTVWGSSGCAGAAAACVLTGAGWPKCTGAGCAGSYIGSALGCALDQLLPQ